MTHACDFRGHLVLLGIIDTNKLYMLGEIQTVHEPTTWVLPARGLGGLMAR